MTETPNPPPNGPVAAALLSCALGCFALSVLAVAADRSKRLAAALIFYRPTGPLSGVTTVALVLWFICWVALARVWSAKSMPLGKIGATAFALLAASLLLTFPPFGDLLLGR